ncbi:hypothetical protein AB0N93_24855 [Streptomyces sp. NPDC091267]|uniref:hypothetical protein n=1 Tax=Streptomyces sp. NPDC091267 TaxID=3155195 RepID=UPI0034279119
MRVRRRTIGALSIPLLLAGCAAPASTPAPRPAAEEAIKAATQSLTDACLTRQGLRPPVPGQSARPGPEERRVSAALFGAGPAELSVALPTGYVVRAHTDGCLAAAQRRLYGDQRGWFRASVIVNNLKPEATQAHRSLAEIRARHSAEIAEWQRLRSHAFVQATDLLDNPPPTGEPQS